MPSLTDEERNVVEAMPREEQARLVGRLLRDQVARLEAEGVGANAINDALLGSLLWRSGVRDSAGISAWLREAANGIDLTANPPAGNA